MNGRELLGPWGEALAAEAYRKRRYRIVAMNYRTRCGEIDLIAQDRSCLVFAEVKLRKNSDFGAAREFVTPRKQERVRRAAELYLSEHDSPLQPRFDVVEIYAPEGLATKHPQIRILEDAFS